jgi:hypothetical protein
LAASFILGLRINPFRYASVVHPTDAVVAQALGVAFEALAWGGVFENGVFPRRRSSLLSEAGSA